MQRFQSGDIVAVKNKCLAYSYDDSRPVSVAGGSLCIMILEQEDSRCAVEGYSTVFSSLHSKFLSIFLDDLKPVNGHSCP